MAPETKESVVIRPANERDVPFIFSCWLRGLRYGNELFELIDAEVYYEVYHQVIQNIITSPGTNVSVACLKEDPEVILGFSVSSGSTLHWTHVKKPWRNIGIAKALAPAHLTTVSHLTKVGVGILKNHPTVRFNPFL